MLGIWKFLEPNTIQVEPAQTVIAPYHPMATLTKSLWATATWYVKWRFLLFCVTMHPFIGSEVHVLAYQGDVNILIHVPIHNIFGYNFNALIIDEITWFHDSQIHLFFTDKPYQEY